jgi:AcrR family transcriptional regulator
MSSNTVSRAGKVAYHGRKPARESSEQRRVAILQAALRVMVRDGVRGVRHRAVAQEAGVPLSATTYYFKDIHDLLADALTLYARDVMENVVNPFWVRVREWLFVTFPLYSGTDIRAQLPMIVDFAVSNAVDDIIDRLTHHRERLMVEQSFWYAILQDERLHALGLDYSQAVLRDATQMLAFIGVEHPASAARLILMTIKQLEVEGLLRPLESLDRDAMKALLMYQVRAICKI